MNKILVVIFDSESQARAGSRSLQELHAEGGIILYSAAIISKAAEGQVDVEEIPGESSLKSLSNPLIAGLIGVLGGSLGTLFGIGALTVPIAGIAGAVGGSYISAMLSFVKLGGREDFANEVAGYLQPGKAALVADVDEERVLPVDTLMESLGGIVFRQPRTDAEFFLIEQDLQALQTELQALRAELAQTSSEHRAKLEAKIETVKANLHARIELAQRLEEATRRVAEFKAESLKKQIATTHSAWKTVLEQRAPVVENDYRQLISSLRQAWQQAQEVLSR